MRPPTPFTPQSEELAMPGVLKQAAAASPRSSLAELEERGAFAARHIGPDADDQAAMLATLGYPTRAALIDAAVPAGIRRRAALDLPAGQTEAGALAELRKIAGRNRVFRSLIGQGYYATHLPGVILRNILESPAWYTAYTPYQPEISQGRLEALINFQTMVCDLTGMAIANASMLDEATAAAEGMALCARSTHSQSKTFYVAEGVLPQTLDVVRTRAEPLGIEVRTAPRRPRPRRIASACCCNIRRPRAR
jgi:glycine dehydrogenase